MPVFIRPSARFLTLAVTSLLLASCATDGGEVATSPTGVLNFQQAAWNDLPGWEDDDVANALPALQKSCNRINKKAPDAAIGRDRRYGNASQWAAACTAIATIPQGNNAAARATIERMFTPWSSATGGKNTGLFTGYYEAALNASHTRTGYYQTPLHARPSDLVMVDLGNFRPELKGQRIAGRVIDGNLKPYEDRSEILAGKLPPGQERVLAWVDDPIEAFFVQIQGSGVLSYPDGSTRRIGYDGQNGHVYTAVGKELVASGALSKDEVSMETIRAWLVAHPRMGRDMMNRNRSYVFFKDMNGQGPVGGEGVVLTPERSLAVDYNYWSYGVPVFVDLAAPKFGAGRIQQLMVAQDTGGAIRGPIRGDVFWGFGKKAEDMAGHMKSEGRIWAVLPKGVNPQ